MPDDKPIRTCCVESCQKRTRDYYPLPYAKKGCTLVRCRACHEAAVARETRTELLGTHRMGGDE